LEPIPVRMLNEVQYCERLFYLMHVQGLFEENADTIEGSMQHRRSEKRSRVKQQVSENFWDLTPQSLHLGDPSLNLVGKLDAISHEDGTWAPIEWKHSSAPDSSHVFYVGGFALSGVAWPNDQIQLCAQALLLQANGYDSNHGYLYYRGNKKRVRIDFTEGLISATKYCIDRARNLQSSEIPKPLVDSNKCFRCSLNYLCLPDETHYLMGSNSNIRRIVPDRVDGGVLYVSEHGSRLSKSGESLIIKNKNGEEVETVPIKDLVHVTIMGNVQCSTQLLHTLMYNGIAVSYLTSHGRLIGVSSPLSTKNIQLRSKQFLRLQHPETALKLAQWIVQAKIHNQRTILRRNGKASKEVLSQLMDLKKRALVTKNLAELLGIEGLASKYYFSAFPSMLKSGLIQAEEIMNGRNRRPPKDPINAMLSLGYTLLLRDMIAVCAGVGLDSHFGFFHQEVPGRPSLALDLMETFRPIIVDSVVIKAWNTKQIQLEDFYIGDDSCLLKKSGRQAFFRAYEQRMNELITHPTFGYKVSYRRILDVETRLFSRFLEGELQEYRPLMTR
jgi:CRISP-associated protein Cas1